jgi:hypothetical protein
MSSLLEQAIVDAKALKEAAYKNAETAVLEKYSVEIKDALKALLEQEEPLDPNTPAAQPGSATSSAITGEDPIQGVPSATTDNEKLCQCPDEEEKVEIDLDKLAAAVSTEEEDMGGPGNSASMSREEDLFPALSENIYKIDTSVLKEEVELEFDKSELLSVLEEETEFHLDHNPHYKGNSWSLGGGVTNHDEDNLKLAKLSKGLKQKNQEVEKLVKDNEELNEKISELTAIAEALANKVEKYQDVVPALKEKLDAFALSNAKLLYTNRVLSNGSLNERQKSKLVETLSNAKTPDEAKTIFETLQSSVQGAVVSTSPKSLSEAVTKNVLTSIPRREQEVVQVPLLERMQILAGIKK